MTEDGIAERIANLLKKAESTTPHEAELLSAKAEELMLKYNIDQAIIDSKRAAGTRESVDSVSILTPGVYCEALAILAVSIAKGLGALEVTCTKPMNKASLAFIRVYGFPSDIKQFETLFTSLQLQCTVAMREYIKNEAWWDMKTAAQKFQARRGFIVGFGSGARVRLERARQHLVAAAEVSSPGTALVLVDRAALVKNALPDNLRKSRTSFSAGAAAYGHQAGLNSNTGGSTIGGSRQALGR